MENNNEQKVLDLVSSSKTGINLTELAKQLDLSRPTIGKYADVLAAKGKIVIEKQGNKKIAKPAV